MAYVVLVVGVVMSLAGLYAILSGYPIIQIERGWATVIAGSTMFTGGLVTMAVGLVLRTLMRIEAGLETRPMALSSEAAVSARAISPKLEPLPLYEPAPAHEPVIGADPLHAEIVPFTAGLEPVLVEPAFMAPVLPPIHDDMDQDDWRSIDQSVEDRNLAAFDEDRLHHTAEPAPVDHPRDLELAEEPGHVDRYELQTPSTPEHDLAPPDEMPQAPLKVEPASQDDWLDHAFSSLDQELSLGPAQRHPEHEEIDHEALAHVPVVEADHEVDHRQEDELAVHADHAEYDEPHGTEATEWVPPAPEVAVIGRYESDGTSYVMFADGSIEAQSEAGIYRFRSMAELKAFIEG